MITTEVRYSDIFYKEAYKVLQILEDFRDLSEIELDNEQLVETLKKINQDVSRGIDNIQKNLNGLMKNMEWNTFNISFFGETNAGKSTLIEALLKGNGNLIGDGRKDFTQTLNSKALDNINLLDMPGIEGNERKYISEIKRGIEKSHVVFYVIGTNKEPEEETLKKIRSFLKDQAKVYSIINVRGKPTAYKYKKEIYDLNIQKIEARTKEKFQKILGEHYIDNIVINAYLGFLSTGNPVREDLKKDQNKLIEIFQSKKNAYDFSNLETVELLIKDLEKSSLDEIAISNTYKFFSSFEDVIARILKGKKDFDEAIKALKKQIENSIAKSKQAIDKYRFDITNLVERKLNKMKNDMQKIVHEGIDNKWSEEVIQGKLNDVKSNFEIEMKDELQRILDELRSDIGDIMEQLQKRIDLEFKFKGIDNSDFNIADIIKKVEVSVKYVLEQILDIGLSTFGVITAFLINPILGIITSVVSLLKKIWEWFSDPNKRRKEAKNKAYNDINNFVENIKRRVRKDTDAELKKLESSIYKQLNGIDKFVNEIKKLSFAMNKKIHHLNNAKVEISKALASCIEKQPIEYAYFDRKLDSGIIIGNHLPVTERNFFRLKELFTFPSVGSYLGSLDHTIEDNFLYLKSPTEFTYRATSNLIEYYKDRDPHLPIKGVRRKHS